MKQCNTCMEWKPLTDYRNPNGIRPAKCRSCRQKIDSVRYKRRHIKNWSDPEYRKKNKLRYRYNGLISRGAELTWEEFLEWVAKEVNGCEICGSFHRLHIDHNHKTRKVRGILCQGCNQAIGCVRESETTLRNAIRYLQICGASDGVGK